MPLNPLVSIVITTYNRSDSLSIVLKALEKQTDTAFEVVIADDGSSNQHCEVIKQIANQCSYPVAYVWHPDTGFTVSRARNLGITVARQEYIILLDGDCVPEKDFVAQHKRMSQSGCLVTGSRILLSEAFTDKVIDGSEDIVGKSTGYWLNTWHRGQINKLTHLCRLPDGAYRIQPTFKWQGIRSCNMGLWRKDLEVVNGFDATFEGWGHEDADLVLRLFHAGVLRKKSFCATEVFHLWHPDANRNAESNNRDRVIERIENGVVRSTLGLVECQQVSDYEVTTFLHW